MKPWARYEIGFIHHDKFLALTASAIALWLEGKDYADSRLTDGLLPLSSVKVFRFYGKKSVQLLTRSCGQNPRTGDPYAPLWEDHPIGFKMHGYLDHNEPRDKAVARIAKAQTDRDRLKGKQQAYRDRRAAERRLEDRRSDEDGAALPPALPPALPENAVTHPVTNPNVAVALPTENSNKVENREQITDNRKNKNTRAGETDDPSAEARFIESTIPAIYAKVRNGALPPVFRPVDFPVVESLVSLYGPRVGDMYELFLRYPPEKKILNQPGTIRQFAHTAPICDADLRKHGR